MSPRCKVNMVSWVRGREHAWLVALLSAGWIATACGKSTSDDAEGNGRGGTSGSTGTSGSSGSAGTDGESGGSSSRAGNGGRASSGGRANAGRAGEGTGADPGSGGSSAGDVGSAGESSSAAHGGAGDGGASDGAGGGSGGSAAGPGVVCTGDVEIANEDELRAFAARGCETLEGTLAIRSDSLRTLDALAPSTLRVITDSLHIVQNLLLYDIGGLAGIQQIERSLAFEGNDLVSDFGGLEDLTALGSSGDPALLSVVQNLLLENVDALANVADWNVSLVVTDNPSLESLAGIKHTRNVPSISITGNTLLNEVDFGELESCASLTLVSNWGLQTLAFPALASSGNMTISGSGSLASLAFPVLQQVSSSITITSNPTLGSLDLDALESVSLLAISDNTYLPQCLVDELDLRLDACDMSCGGNRQDATCD